MHNTRHKILSAEEARRAAGHGDVVFTNGCFDIIHPGHVDYLQRARDLGSCLVVGLNSDASVRRLKGPTRPVNDQESRALVLAALACVDFVVVFDEDTPYELIGKIRPRVLVKGGDWSVDRIVGRDIVEEGGGKVYSIPLLEGYSTTAVVDRIISLHKGAEHG
jgi:rfaE bifunctional protein nucleotidyltransferase chain/domain